MNETTKQQLLEELRKEYQVTLKPLKEAKFSISDIQAKYWRQICDKTGCPRDYNSENSIFGAIRKVMCLHYNATTLQDIESDKRNNFRNDTEKFIKEFILKEN